MQDQTNIKSDVVTWLKMYNSKNTGGLLISGSKVKCPDREKIPASGHTERKCFVWVLLACVAGVERGRGRGNLGARESVWFPSLSNACHAGWGTADKFEVATFPIDETTILEIRAMIALPF